MTDDEGRGGPGPGALAIGYARAGLERLAEGCLDVVLEIALRVLTGAVLTVLLAVATWAWQMDPWLAAGAGLAVVALALHGARVLVSTRRLRPADRV